MSRVGLSVATGVTVALLALGWQALSAPVANTAPAKKAPVPEGAALATFGGGCFWCMEPPFDKLDGVYSTVSGYAGGEEKNPTYKQVSAGKTGHTEVVQITYDPKKVTYQRLLEVFWRNIDPTVENRQFCDGGKQYRTAIYAHDEAQLVAAKKSFEEIAALERFEVVYTEVEPLDRFYPAEEYHQNFYKKNPDHYYRYRRGCRRDERLQQLWGDEAGG